jgi:molybdopterin molybdotransferase
MVISTGDELIDPGEPILEHQVRRSNVYAVVAALHEHGFAHVGSDHVLDKEAMLHERLAQHLAECDVVILSGGVSKGKFDFVPKALKSLEVDEVFYQVAQRPGAPMWFGIGPRGQAVFGLPGNPVSTLMCSIRYVIPALHQAMGIDRGVSELIGLASALKLGRKSMASFVPVTIQYDAQGARSARHHTPNGSGDFLSLAATDGFIELPPRAEAFPEGFVGELYRW